MIKVRVGDFKIKEEEKQAITNVLESGRISEGEKVREFENEFARFIGTEYAIAVTTGTSAIIAGLHALKHYKNIKSNSNVS